MRRIAIEITLGLLALCNTANADWSAGKLLRLTPTTSPPGAWASGQYGLWVDSANGFQLKFINAAGVSVSSPAIAATTKGDISVYSGTAWGRLAAGTNAFCLVADSTQTLGVKWASCGGGGSTGNWTFAGNVASLSVAGTMTLTSTVAGSAGANDAFALKSSNDLTAGGGTWVGNFQNQLNLVAQLTGVTGASSIAMYDGAGSTTDYLAFLSGDATLGATLAARDRNGTNLVGTSLTLRGGLATGSAATGDTVIQYAPVGASGTTLQTATDAVRVNGSTGKVTFATGIATEAWREVGAGGQPVLGSGIANVAAKTTLAFYKDPMGVVHLKGGFTAGLGAGSLVFTLPAGYRPQAQHNYNALAESAGGVYASARVSIDTNGDITIFLVGNTANYLDGFTFPVQ